MPEPGDCCFARPELDFARNNAANRYLSISEAVLNIDRSAEKSKYAWSRTVIKASTSVVLADTDDCEKVAFELVNELSRVEALVLLLRTDFSALLILTVTGLDVATRPLSSVVDAVTV
jgi:hypothetical protein